MADLTISRPEAGERTVVEQAAGSRLLCQFTPGDAILERTGDDLVFLFEDNGEVVLRGFYTAYTKETLPDFVFNSDAVTGADFFAALGEDLQPAAGPAAAQTLANGGRFSNLGMDSLMEGVDRLGGLDLGLTDAGIEDTALFASGGGIGPVLPAEPAPSPVPPSAPAADPVVPEEPGTPDEEPVVPEEPGAPDEPVAPEEPVLPEEPVVPEEPDTPDQPGGGTVPGGPDDPEDPGIPDRGQPTLDDSRAEVNEADLPDGSKNSSGANNATTTGTFTLTLNGEGGTVQIGSGPGAITLTIGPDGTLKSGGDQPYDTGKGQLSITDVRTDASGTTTVTYSYTLKEEQFHDQATHDTSLADEVPLLVTDGSGDTVSGSIIVDILDDVPSLSVSIDGVEQGTRVDVPHDTTVTGKLDPDFGADKGTLDDMTVNGKPGTPVDGHLRFELDEGVLTIHPGDKTFAFDPHEHVTGEVKLEFGIFDTDRDTARDADGNLPSITITLDGTLKSDSLELSESGLQGSRVPNGDPNARYEGVPTQSGYFYTAEDNTDTTFSIANLKVGDVLGSVTLPDAVLATLPGNLTAADCVVRSLSTKGDVTTVTTNYGNFVLNTETGEYSFILTGDYGYEDLNALPEDARLELNLKLTSSTGQNKDVNIAITGTDDGITIADATKDANAPFCGNKSWLDVKDDGEYSSTRNEDGTWTHENSTDFEYNNAYREAYLHPNNALGYDKLDPVHRLVGKLPLLMQDPDLGAKDAKLEYTLVFNQVLPNTNLPAPNMAGRTPAVDAESFELSGGTPALAAAWEAFKASVDSLDSYKVIQTAYGILVLDTQPDAEGNTWFTFLVDKDAPEVQRMGESYDDGLIQGAILQFSLAAKNSITGVDAEMFNPDGSSAGKAYSIFVHVHGSNDAPELLLEGSRIHMTDADITNDAHSYTLVVGGVTLSGENSGKDIVFTDGEETLTLKNVVISVAGETTHEFTWEATKGFSKNVELVVTDRHGAKDSLLLNEEPASNADVQNASYDTQVYSEDASYISTRSLVQQVWGEEEPDGGEEMYDDTSPAEVARLAALFVDQSPELHCDFFSSETGLLENVPSPDLSLTSIAQLVAAAVPIADESLVPGAVAEALEATGTDPVPAEGADPIASMNDMQLQTHKTLIENGNV